jgi:hypothetical protein
MEKKLTVQAVSGAIRATKGIISSAKFQGSSRLVRSTGIYAEKRRFSGEIIIDVWTSGYEHAARRGKEDMPKVIETLESKGFKVIEKQEAAFYGTDIKRTVRIVELA